jgi:hypothetical protein
MTRQGRLVSLRKMGKRFMRSAGGVYPVLKVLKSSNDGA